MGRRHQDVLKSGPVVLGYAAAIVQTHERRHDVGPELHGAAGLHDTADLRAGAGRALRLILPERGDGVGEPEDARSERDVVSAQPVGVAASVPPLVVVADEGRDALEMRDRRDGGLAPDGVELDALAGRAVEMHDRILPCVLGQPDHS